MKLLKTLLVVLTMSAPVYAQQNPQPYNAATPWERYSHYALTVRGGGAFPVGPFSSGYISKSTIQSYSIGLDWVLQGPISVGAEVGKTFFSQRIPRAVYQDGKNEISAVQTRTVALMPIQGVLSYYFAPPSAMIRPYLQVSAGADLLNYTLYYGNLADQQQSVKFSYGGAAGAKFLFKRDGSIGADIRVKYNQTALDFGYVDKGIGQVNATVGLFYRWW